jgi:uncharacterized repeat protein (TIGR01451 family)
MSRIAVCMCAAAWLLGSCTTRRVTEVEIRTVAIAPAAPSVAAGSSVQLNATVSDDRGITILQVEIEWTSDDDSIATVDADGSVTGRRPGTTYIRATSRGVEGVVLLAVDPGPFLKTTSDSVQLFGPPGSSPHAAVLVENQGVGTLSDLQATVSYEGAASGWLPVSLTGNTAPATLNMTASTESLAVGEYRAVIVLAANAGNSPKAIPVSLVVTEQEPVIAAAPSSITPEGTAGRAEPGPVTVAVTNGGGGTLSGLSASVWYGGATAGWLSASLAGSTAPTQLTVTADARALAPGTYHGEVRLASPEAINSPNSIPVWFVVARPPEAADVSSTMSGPTVATSGDQVDYLITVRNLGPDTARTVVVTAQTPTGASFVSSTGGSHAGGILTWNAGTLSAGSAQAISVRLRMDATGPVVYRASAASAVEDTVAGNNQAQVTTTVSPAPRADLVVGLSAPTSAEAGAQMTLQVTARNDGPDPAASAVVRATLPTGVSFQSASGGGTHSSGVVTWSAGTLGSGVEVSYDLVVRLGSGTSGNVTHSVTAMSSALDPVPDNSTASATTLVVGSHEADVAVTLLGPASASQGALVQYSITVTNNGPARTNELVVTLPIPAQTTFFYATRGRVSDGVFRWSPRELRDGESTSTSLYVRVATNASGDITGSVSVSTATSDPLQSNNSATHVMRVE